jgi:tetratricopeptide (TPR) repeat protein
VVSVRVVGTQFDVLKTGRREGMEVEVAVKRGIVEVQRADRGGDVRRITAGETWSAWISSDPAAKPLAAWISSDNNAAAPEPAVVNTPEPPKPAVVEQPAPAPTPAPRTAPASAAPSGDKHVAAEGVRALFLRANVARRAGRVQEAANAYAELLKSFPRDSRAAVSAFELGRIRMDALSDPKAAAAAFAESLRLSHRAQFREDALARLALAYDATGEWDSCRKIRGRYLTDYPGGVHTNALSSLCGEHAD